VKFLYEELERITVAMENNSHYKQDSHTYTAPGVKLKVK